jgi:hypothetical protein
MLSDYARNRNNNSRIHLAPKIAEFAMNPDNFSGSRNIQRLFDAGLFYLHRAHTWNDNPLVYIGLDKQG